MPMSARLIRKTNRNHTLHLFARSLTLQFFNLNDLSEFEYSILHLSAEPNISEKDIMEQTKTTVKLDISLFKFENVPLDTQMKAHLDEARRAAEELRRALEILEQQLEKMERQNSLNSFDIQGVMSSHNPIERLASHVLAKMDDYASSVVSFIF
jgi:hypothetical protein